MSLRTRVIACLYVKHGRVVKGVNLVNLTDEGDPVDLSASYAEEGIDEIVYLDIAVSPGIIEIQFDSPRSWVGAKIKATLIED